MSLKIELGKNMCFLANENQNSFHVIFRITINLLNSLTTFSGFLSLKY